ncbi:MAG: hypothetical protein H7Z19_11695 [Chitinophagaceae bacterium]|nr:hypothetical protein [Rubrivivax sp.]
MTRHKSPAPDAQAAWPLLQQGFFGRPLMAADDRLLGIDLTPGPRGGPVFDARGHLVGMAVPGADGRDRLVSIDVMTRHGPGIPDVAPAAAGAGERVPVDRLYETGLRMALQVLVQLP